MLAGLGGLPNLFLGDDGLVIVFMGGYWLLRRGVRKSTSSQQSDY